MDSYAAQVAKWWLGGRSCHEVEMEVPDDVHPKSLRGPPGSVDRDLIPPANHPLCMGEFLGCVDLARFPPLLRDILVVPCAALGPAPVTSSSSVSSSLHTAALRRRMIACP